MEGVQAPPFKCHERLLDHSPLTHHSPLCWALNDEAGFVSYLLLRKEILNDEAAISLKCKWKFGKHICKSLQGLPPKMVLYGDAWLSHT